MAKLNANTVANSQQPQKDPSVYHVSANSGPTSLFFPGVFFFSQQSLSPQCFSFSRFSIFLPGVFFPPSGLFLPGVFLLLGFPLSNLFLFGVLSLLDFPLLGLSFSGVLLSSGFLPLNLPLDLFPPNFLPSRCPCCLSVDSNASFQHEHGFANHIELNRNSIPFAFDHPANNICCTKRLDLEGMTRQCEYCHALYWSNKHLQDSAFTSTVFEKYCKKGIVPLSLFQDSSVNLQCLLVGDKQQERKFCRHIQQYNAALAFTSMRYVADTRVTSCQSLNAFQVHGKVYHIQGPLEASSLESTRYAQLFFYNLDYATNLYHQRNSELDKKIMGNLTQMLEYYNPYILVYCTAHKRLQRPLEDTNAHELKFLLDMRLSLVVKAGAD